MLWSISNAYLLRLLISLILVWTVSQNFSIWPYADNRHSFWWCWSTYIYFVTKNVKMSIDRTKWKYYLHVAQVRTLTLAIAPSYSPDMSSWAMSAVDCLVIASLRTFWVYSWLRACLIKFSLNITKDTTSEYFVGAHIRILFVLWKHYKYWKSNQSNGLDWT